MTNLTMFMRASSILVANGAKLAKVETVPEQVSFNDSVVSNINNDLNRLKKAIRDQGHMGTYPYMIFVAEDLMIAQNNLDMFYKTDNKDCLATALECICDAEESAQFFLGVTV